MIASLARIYVMTGGYDSHPGFQRLVNRSS